MNNLCCWYKPIFIFSLLTPNLLLSQLRCMPHKSQMDLNSVHSLFHSIASLNLSYRFQRPVMTRMRLFLSN